MAFSDWYQHKAEQCVRMAAVSSDPKVRARLREEAAFWREIGADVIKQERAERMA